MSTFEAKVAVVTDFLANRASLHRVTNLQELGVVAGHLLAERGLRGTSAPVRRDKLKAVLHAINQQTHAEQGILLGAIVVHFWDNEPGHGFYESAQQIGLNTFGDGAAFHAAEQQKTFAAYPDFVGINDHVTAPDDAQDLDESELLDDEEQDVDETPFELERVAAMLSKASEGLLAYVGRHRN